MGILRDALNRLLDGLDPPKPANQSPRAPCPACRRNVLQDHVREALQDGLSYFLCRCGRASAWHVNGHGPQLVYGDNPPEFDDGEE